VAVHSGSSANDHAAHITLLDARNSGGVIYSLAEIVPAIAGIQATHHQSY